MRLNHARGGFARRFWFTHSHRFTRSHWLALILLPVAVAAVTIATAVVAEAMRAGPHGAAELAAARQATFHPGRPPARSVTTFTSGGCALTQGRTANLAITHSGPAPDAGTIFAFPAHTRCTSLSLSYASATDRYEGWLYDPRAGAWFACTEGWVEIPAGPRGDSRAPSLCGGVSPGVNMAVVAESGLHRTVTVED